MVAENLFSYGIWKNKNLVVGLISYFSFKLSRTGFGSLNKPWGRAVWQLVQKK